MITIISGKPGVGKTALNTYFCLMTYETEREQLLKVTRKCIEEINKNRLHPLTVPKDPPIFTNFEASFHIGYEQYYAPYYVNPYYLGLASDKLPTINLPPFSRVFISEAQRYYNSRKSSTLPDWVSRWYEMHRHYGIEIYMDVQRVKLIDLNVRELCKRFIEVQKMDIEKDASGWINKTRWHCREFDNMQTLDEYIAGTGKEYVETVYEYEGDIFKSYNSTSCFDEFVPGENADFHLLPYGKAPSEELKLFYDVNEPEAYRNPTKQQKKEQSKNAT